ncbi:MAG: hypothetical protein DRI48_01375 [Chloroflexi bacterium]|nr:MAG: hypothetical protein DRI48_01375 [Chloroflexota bacterium]
MFQIGDPVVHPVRGAGVVTGIEELQRHGKIKAYYRIKLLGQTRTSLMIPVEGAAAKGLRRAIQQSKLNRVRRVLCADPQRLPANHKARYELVKSKLRTGDLLQVAEAVRDMAWRQRREGSLNTRGKRIYKRGIKLLAGEIAVALGVELDAGEAQVRKWLWKNPSLEIATAS